MDYDCYVYVLFRSKVAKLCYDLVLEVEFGESLGLSGYHELKVVDDDVGDVVGVDCEVDRVKNAVGVGGSEKLEKI
jgi:hypothetical protein